MNIEPRNKFQDFIDNQSFVDWVRNPTPESNDYWEEYISQHPFEREYLNQARYILSKFRDRRNSPSDNEIEKVWSNIHYQILNPKRKFWYINGWSVAASILLVVGIGTGIFFQITENKDEPVNYSSLAMKLPVGNEVKLILSDNTEKHFATDDPSIKYDKNGEILVDSVAISKETNTSGKFEREEFNQLIVPKGKRSSLTFSDGTKLYLNSGSQVIYPVTFNKQSREIYIRGEGYLEVAHNANCPFIVKTDHMDVRVLGTEFNIKSYPDETSSSVVLVKGSIQATVKSYKIMMKESELLTLDNSTQKTSLEKTSVLEYITWKDGWMYCTNEKMESIAKKLSRYYDVDIEFSDPKVESMTLTGKLDLKTNCREIFDVISFIAPVTYQMVDDTKIILTTKNN